MSDTSARISRDQMYMGMADLLSLRSTCLRGHVGALIVVAGRPAGGGYNGAPSGLPHCDEVGCDELILYEAKGLDLTKGSDFRAVELGCQRAIHAELNAIAWAARHGVATAAAELYCTHSPCKACAQAIIAAKFRRFIFKKDYRLGRLDILRSVKMEITKLGEEGEDSD